MTTISADSQTGLQTTMLAALRHPNFRLYFFGQVISLSGTWMQTIAQGWLVYQLTQSELWLGIVACAAGLPMLLLAPAAGVLVDRVPRRTLLLISQSAQMLLAFTLAALVFAGVAQVAHIIALAFLLGITNALDAPSRQSIIVDLVGHEDLNSGIALNAIMFNLSRIIGPAAAGLLLTQVGPAWCFLLNGISYLGMLIILFIIHPEAQLQVSGSLAPLRRLKEGLRFARSHPTIAPMLLLAAITSLTTINLSTLLPAFAAEILQSPAEAYAAMSTGMGIGAVAAAALMTILGKVFGRGRVVTAMVVWVMATGLAVSGTASIPTAVALISLFGFGIILQFVTMNTLIQSVVPDAFRGRVMSLYTLTFFGVAPFGALALGALADAISTPSALAVYVLLGGLLSLAILVRAPQVRALQ